MSSLQALALTPLGWSGLKADNGVTEYSTNVFDWSVLFGVSAGPSMDSLGDIQARILPRKSMEESSQYLQLHAQYSSENIGQPQG